jgi:hypothetical protein
VVKVVIPLHGIRTHAEWQRAFVTVTQYPKYNNVFNCPLDNWNFGHFSLFKFLTRSGREKKIQWFRDQYYRLMSDRNIPLEKGDYPSIVAHSFGTYILGQVILRYPYIKLDKIILCGSILPRSFPWELLIQRGQVQEVRNEYGIKDIWVRYIDRFIKDMGSSGYNKFETNHPKVIQEQFLYKHSDYFEKGHMEEFWIPFLNSSEPMRIRVRSDALQLSFRNTPEFEKVEIMRSDHIKDDYIKRTICVCVENIENIRFITHCQIYGDFNAGHHLLVDNFTLNATEKRFIPVAYHFEPPFFDQFIHVQAPHSEGYFAEAYSYLNLPLSGSLITIIASSTETKLAQLTCRAFVDDTGRLKMEKA